MGSRLDWEKGYGLPIIHSLQLDYPNRVERLDEKIGKRNIIAELYHRQQGNDLDGYLQFVDPRLS